jgi:hypothetical protein
VIVRAEVEFEAADPADLVRVVAPQRAVTGRASSVPVTSTTATGQPAESS